jgi:hypothetical protein
MESEPSASQQHCGGGGGASDEIPEFMYIDTTVSPARLAARAAAEAATME